MIIFVEVLLDSLSFPLDYQPWII